VSQAKRCLNPSSQCSRILAHLVSGQTLTPLGALKKFGTLRLGARIYELRGRHHHIESAPIKVAGKTVAIYWMPEYERKSVGQRRERV
jgi:hypothetical protein